jgi:hypothetical protein
MTGSGQEIGHWRVISINGATKIGQPIEGLLVRFAFIGPTRASQLRAHQKQLGETDVDLLAKCSCKVRLTVGAHVPAHAFINSHVVLLVDCHLSHGGRLRNHLIVLYRPDYFRLHAGLNILLLDLERIALAYSAYSDKKPLPELASSCDEQNGRAKDRRCLSQVTSIVCHA